MRSLLFSLPGEIMQVPQAMRERTVGVSLGCIKASVTPHERVLDGIGSIIGNIATVHAIICYMDKCPIKCSQHMYPNQMKYKGAQENPGKCLMCSMPVVR